MDKNGVKGGNGSQRKGDWGITHMEKNEKNIYIRLGGGASPPLRAH